MKILKKYEDYNNPYRLTVMHRRMKDFKKVKSNFAIESLKIFIAMQSIWWYSHWFTIKKRKGIYKIYISTCGWSDNEAMIEMLQRSLIWIFYWEESRRGGHYKFEIDTNMRDPQ